MQNMLLDASSHWSLYVLMGLLLIGNILMIILYISSAVKYNDLEKELKFRISEKISKTEYDKEKDKPLSVQIETDEKSEYIVVENSKNNGWCVIKRGEKAPVAFASTKEEAKEITKNLLKDK